MATKKAATAKAANAPSEGQLFRLVRIIGHTGRMNLMVEQSPSGQSHKDRGYDTIIDGYKAEWNAAPSAHRKAAIEAAQVHSALIPKDIKAAVAALED